VRLIRSAAVAAVLTAALTWVAWLAAASTASAATRARVTPPAPTASVSACYDFAVGALRGHVVVRRTPPACAGLAAQQVNEAVARAIRTVVGPLPKAAGRRLAVADSHYLSSLVRPAAPGRPAQAVPAPGTAGSTVPVRLAALLAWLMAAIPGGWLLASRLSSRRRRDRAPPGLPWVPLSHAGAAATGLALWVAFLLAGSPLVGWLDVAMTWLIAGLGMATLLAGPTGQDATSASLAAATTGTATLALAGRRAPVLTIALHGALAATTMVLVLVAVLSVG
jgi:manganese efflux pump family protein